MFKPKDFARNTKYHCRAVSPRVVGKMPAVREGILTFHSTNFSFTWPNTEGEMTTSWGDKPRASECTDYGFNITAYSGDVMEYTLTEIKE